MRGYRFGRRGKCLLELAGYDLSQVPLARYLREHSIVPLVSAQPEIVPKWKRSLDGALRKIRFVV